jgi:hypothetical protein
MVVSTAFSYMYMEVRLTEVETKDFAVVLEGMPTESFVVIIIEVQTLADHILNNS